MSESVKSFGSVRSYKREKTMLSGKPGFSNQRKSVEKAPFDIFNLTHSSQNDKGLIYSSDQTLVTNVEKSGRVDIMLNRQVIIDTIQDVVNSKINEYENKAVQEKVSQLEEDFQQTNQVLTESLQQLQSNMDELHTNIQRVNENIVINQSQEFTNEKNEKNDNLLEIMKTMTISENDVLELVKNNTLTHDDVQKMIQEKLDTKEKVDPVVVVPTPPPTTIPEAELKALEILTQKIGFLKTLPDQLAGLFHGDILIFSRGDGTQAKFESICLQDLIEHVNSENHEKMDELANQNEILSNQVQQLTEQMAHLKAHMVIKPPVQKLAIHAPSSKASKVAPTGAKNDADFLNHF